MKRDYATGETEDAKYFTGIEVETTPAYGLLTLFVVGIQPAEDVLDLAKFHKCNHIYLGANHSFEATPEYCDFINAVAQSGILTTIDFDVKHAEWIADSCLCSMNNVIPQISVKIPYVDYLGYNATLKIDDKDFKASNAGVWCHQVRDLQSRSKFTSWNKYTNDNIIE
jgi:hypothetical protein